MKNLIISFLIAHFSFLISQGGMAQGCLPEGITFTTQAQIDDFQANFPGCTEILGDVAIVGDQYGSSITNVDGLSMISSMGGDLVFQYTYVLTDLTGLAALNHIGGDFKIAHTDLPDLEGLENLVSIGGSLLIDFNNNSLITLNGLNGLTSVGGDVLISNNLYLTDLSGLSILSSIGGDLEIIGNSALISLAGLDNLSFVGGDLLIHNNYTLSSCEAAGICTYLNNPNGVVDIIYNDDGCNSPTEIANTCGITIPCLPYGNYYFIHQADIDSFQDNYPGCTALGGNVQIGKQWENSNISNLSGLNIVTSIDSNLILWNNNLLSSLSGLENLSSIGGKLDIFRNNLLSGLSGLENLSYIGGNLEIIQNNSLSGLTGLDALQYIGGECKMIGNDALLSLSALHGLDSIGGSLTLGTYPFDLEPCQGNPVLTSLTGLDSLNKIGGSLGIICTSLADMTGLGSLASIGGSFIIHGNDALVNLTGLDNLDSIGGNLSIGEFSWSYSMPNPSLSSLEGLDGLTAVGGSVSMQSNYVLNDLTSLGQLSTIGGNLMISGTAITTLNGLEGLDSIGGGLYLTNNNSLSSLAGLENLAPGSITNLTITHNNTLSNCNAQSICDYLSGPNGTVNIYSNAAGCNSPVEVATGCGITLPCLPFGDYHFFTQADVDNFKVNYPECTDLQGNVIIGEGVSHLDSLNSIISIGGTLDLSGGFNLTSLSGLDNLQAIGGDLNVSGAYNLANFSGLDQLEFIEGNLSFGNNNDSLTSLTGLEGLTSVGGYLYIGTSHNLNDLTGLNNLATIGGGLSSPGGLPDYRGLEGLTSIGGTVWIQFEYSLVNFVGLENVESIGGDLVVNICNVSSMDGLNNLNHIGGRLIISSNDYMGSLSGLHSLTTIGGKLDITLNPPLESLSGLENIQAGSISYLEIKENIHLSECAVQSVCDYLANPYAIKKITNNAPGCNSPQQVEAACAVGVETPPVQSSEFKVQSYPNPTDGVVDLQFTVYILQRITLKIYDIQGREVAVVLDEVMPAGEHTVRWDAGRLPAGVYNCRLSIVDCQFSTWCKMVKY